MKMLVSRTPVSNAAPFDLEALKEHMRLYETDEDAAVENMGWTAAQEVEQLAQIALLTQNVRVVIFDPGNSPDLRLPIGPVADGSTLTIMMDGEAFTDFILVGGTRAMVRLGRTFFDLSPDMITIEYPAGFGDAATAIPRDLAQAIMDQSALHYDGRSPMDAKCLTTSPHMARIAARYRGVQV